MQNANAKPKAKVIKPPRPRMPFGYRIRSVLVGSMILVGGYMFVSGYLSFQARMSYYGNNCDLHGVTCKRTAFGFDNGGEARARESAFRTVCPTWAAQNIFGRYVTYRDRSWCSDYIDRL